MISIDKRFLFCFAVVLSILVASCSPVGNEAIPSLVPTVATYAITTVTAASTPQPIATVVTPTSFPTLTEEQAQNTIGELLAKNGNCVKPCFWGFSPATATKDAEVLDFFASLHEEPRVATENENTQYIVSIGYEEYIKLSATFTFDNKQNSLMNVRAAIHGLYYPEVDNKDWEAFRPESILKTYGKPSNIEFFLNYPTEPTIDSTIGYEFLFKYESDNFIIKYTGQRTLDQPQLRICPLEDPTIESIYLFLGDAVNSEPSHGKAIEDVSSLTIDDFSNALIEGEDNVCFLLNQAAFHQ